MPWDPRMRLPVVGRIRMGIGGWRGQRGGGPLLTFPSCGFFLFCFYIQHTRRSLEKITSGQGLVQPQKKGTSLLEHTDHPRLRLVKDQVVNLVITVNQRHAIPRPQLLITEKPHQVLVVRQVTDGHARLDVLDGGLRRADITPRAQLPGEEAAVLAEVAQADLGKLDGVQRGQRADRIGPHGAPVGSRDAGQGRVLKDAAVEKLHDVKGGADDGGVLAQAVGFRDGQAAVQGGDDAVLALDLVRGPRHQLSRGLLAHHVPAARAVRQLVRRVRLPVAELLDLERRLDLGHVGTQVRLEGLDVDGVPYWAGHGLCVGGLEPAGWLLCYVQRNGFSCFPPARLSCDQQDILCLVPGSLPAPNLAVQNKV